MLVNIRPAQKWVTDGLSLKTSHSYFCSLVSPGAEDCKRVAPAVVSQGKGAGWAVNDQTLLFSTLPRERTLGF